MTVGAKRFKLLESAYAAGPVHGVLFQRVSPIPPRHPRSSYPMLPVIGKRSGLGAPLQVTSRFLSPDACYTTSGAAAILCALQGAGVKAGDEVLVPAYHCPTMVWPVQLAGAVPVFVPMREDLLLDVDRLRPFANARVRALLMPHFFGVLQPAANEIKIWCDRRGIALVEDCAHAFYSGDSARLPGSVGHFAIASTRKFFPGTEGGAIVANGGVLDLRLPSARLFDEFRTAVGAMQLAHEYGSLPWQGGARSARNVLVEGADDSREAAREAEPREASASELASAAASRKATTVTRLLVEREPHAVSAGIRRARWLRWRDVIQNMVAAKSFCEVLPPDVVPYVFAVRLRRPDKQFAALKYAGVQVWRWDRLARSQCEASRRLGLELVQLPCQQSLTDERFEQLVQGFRDAIASA